MVKNIELISENSEFQSANHHITIARNVDMRTMKSVQGNVCK